MVESHSGTPDAAVRSGSRPAPPDGRVPDGQKKALGVPYAYGRWLFFCGLQDRSDLRPAACELRSFYGAPLAMTRPVTLAAPFCFKAWAQASKVAPVVKISSQRCLYLIQ